MVDSNVPRYSNLASELHRNYLFKFKLVLPSARSNTHMMDLLCERIYKLPFQLQQLIWRNRAYSFNSLWTRITTMFQEKSSTYHISEQIIRRFFPKSCDTSFTFEQFHWFIQLWNENAATLRKFGAFFVQSCDRFLFPFYPFSLFSLSFLIFLK